MATTETSATDSKVIMKDTTEQDKSDSLDERVKIHQVLFCSVMPFIIVVAVSVVAITVSIDKNSNQSKTNIHSTVSHISTDFNNKAVHRGSAQTGGALRP